MSLFITFEGGEGSGKSSQLLSLTKRLELDHIPFIKTQEPGGTTIGNSIRQILLDPANTDMLPRTEILLYLASRKQHLEQVIRPAMADNKVVFCDRYEDSTFVYQGLARALGLDYVKELSRLAGIDLKPDMTLLFDVSPEIGLARARGRLLEGNTRFENEQMKFHEEVRNGFLLLAADEPERFVVLDASQPFAIVEAELHQLIKQRLAVAR
jgi:dTMP kinase